VTWDGEPIIFMNSTILIVEDDPNIALGLEEILKSEGFIPIVCRRGDQVHTLAVKEQPALIILDIMLPGLSGYDACKLLRKKGITTPILMLTAKGQEMDKVIGLELGADDYVTKPFGVRELLARIHALLRRTKTTAVPETPEKPFKIGSSTIDPATFQIRRGRTREELTAKELKLLQLFHSHPGEVFSRDRILNEVWGQNYYGTTRTLDQVIVQLRKKLGDSADDPAHIVTVHGVGYKLLR
jgi:DNA-binding response OmpR family regulator